MTGRLITPLVGAALLVAVAAAALGSGEGAAARERQALLDVNPCLERGARRLRCPDLVMRPPYGLTAERTRGGRVLLRAGNSIDSVGTGPVELHGRRDGRATMAVSQRIYRTDGRHISVETGGRLAFYPIPGQYRYWKFRNAARFELWRLNARNERVELVKTGPKVFYCFRDLQRRNPSRRSPRKLVYPKCSQNPRARRVTLGTSVGWSDVYPARYHEQWIDVTGLRGRFAYVHIADPANGIYESDEENNVGEVIVRLPFRRGSVERGASRVEPPPAPEEPSADY